MERVVRKFDSFAAAEQADNERYRAMSGNEKLQLLLDLVMPENPDAVVIERSARVYPLRNKQATGRAQDLSDLELLEQMPQPEGRSHEAASGH